MARPVDRAAKMRCSPHQWRTPRPGDDAIQCAECGKRLDLLKDLAKARGQIYTRRGRTDVQIETWRLAFWAAVNDAERRALNKQDAAILAAVEAGRSLADVGREFKLSVKALRRHLNWIREKGPRRPGWPDVL